MGRYKDLLIQQEDQGWRFSNQRICRRCVTDPYLKSVIDSNATGSRCSFCGRSSSAPFDVIMDVVAGAVFQYYSHAVNVAARDSEEGGYLGDTFDTSDMLLFRIGPPSSRDSVNDAIVESFGDEVWCERDMYRLDGAERYLASWDEFCETVKHRRRFFFGSVESDEFSETIPVPLMLQELERIVREFDLVRSLPAGSRLWRVRVHGSSERCDSWRTLGSPPDAKAVSSRMSPAGISLFYGAMEATTALREAAASADQRTRPRYTLSEWILTRDASVLDVSDLPDAPSFYEGRRAERDALLFLAQFVHKITQPVTHDGREHIDYVPTQILTEFFRQTSAPEGTPALDGIVYPSARRPQRCSLLKPISIRKTAGDALRRSSRSTLAPLDPFEFAVRRRES